MIEENNKTLEILKDLLYDLPVCGCTDEALEDLEIVMDFTLDKEDFNKSLVETYLDITCGACSEDVAEEFQEIVNA